MESFIPLYEWDYPKKKSKRKEKEGGEKDKSKADRKSKKSKETANGITAPVPPTVSAGAGPRSATVEEVEE